MSSVNDWSLPELTFVDYGPNAAMVITNNGHTIQATYTNGYYNNDRSKDFYQMSQFHFHTHSEESVQGVGDKASMHMVHALNPAPAGNGNPALMALSVLGVLFVVGPDDNPILAPIVNAINLGLIPLVGNTTVISFGGFQAAFAAAKAGSTNDYWNFPGSLTTPPCTEQIDWTLLATPWYMSQAQLDTFNSILVADTNSVVANTSNYRRVQRNISSVSYRPGSYASAFSASLVLVLSAIFALFL